MPFKLADFYNETRRARKIIVIDLGYLGDTIHLLPALREIKENYPHAELHVASALIGSELLAMAPAVDHTWPLTRSARGTPWREQCQWVRQVRRESFDVAFNFSGTDRTIFLTWLTGARWRVAFAGGRQHLWNAWFIPFWVPRRDRSIHVSEQRRQVLASCGLRLGPPRYDLKLPADSIQWAKEYVPHGAVHLSLNAGHSLKEWPLDRWIDFTRMLLREYPDLAFVASGTGSPREKERLHHFAQSLESKRIRIYAGTLNVAQLAALLAQCRLHIGADSGALHLAGVLGVPTVSLFRDYAGLGEWLPRGPKDRTIVVPCRCVNQKVQPCASGQRPECLNGITVAAVQALVRELLESPQ